MLRPSPMSRAGGLSAAGGDQGGNVVHMELLEIHALREALRRPDGKSRGVCRAAGPDV